MRPPDRAAEAGSGGRTVTAKVFLASGNRGKINEMRRLLPGVEVVGAHDVPEWHAPPETADTFEGNALIKARSGCVASGLATIADDSGLAVDVLNGMPGVRSARWSGADATDDDNLHLLLRQLSDVATERRGAHFVCAIAAVFPDGTEIVKQGTMPGRLGFEPEGDHGFGYDPIFVPEGQQRTSAQLTPAEKDAISHRGAALRALIPELLEHLDR